MNLPVWNIELTRAFDWEVVHVPDEDPINIPKTINVGLMHHYGTVTLGK